MEFKWPKRSHRDVDTYFEGYEKQTVTDPATGRTRTEYVYRGAYYIFQVPDEAYRRFRLSSLGRVICATALFGAAHALGPRGSVLPYIGLPALISLIPLIYLWLGLGVLLRTKTPRMTIREYAFGLERMENVLWIVLILWGIAAGGELIYLLVKGLFTAAELAAAGMEAAAFVLLLLQQRAQAALLAVCVNRPERTKKG